MSFASPIWLLSLALIPLAIAAYVASQRRRTRYAVRYPALATLRAAAGDRGASWPRHLPAALLVLAIAALTLALAKPRTTYRVPVDSGSIMLVIDHSGSMAANDVLPSRLQAVKTAANTFINKLPAGVKLGAIGFSTTPDAAQAPVLDHDAARALVDSEQAAGSTATGNALALALELLHASVKSHPPSAIILLSDGAANAGQSPVTVAHESAADHIPIYTVALGTPDGELTVESPLGIPEEVPVPPDPQLMSQIAQSSGGRSYDVQDAGTLDSVYEHLGDELGSESRRRQITSEFAIAAIALLLLAVALSVRFSGRLP